MSIISIGRGSQKFVSLLIDEILCDVIDKEYGRRVSKESFNNRSKTLLASRIP